MQNEQMLVAVNLLNRVNGMLSEGTRVQLAADTVVNIVAYLSKALKYLEPWSSTLGNDYVLLSKAVLELNDITDDNLSNEQKTNVTAIVIKAIAGIKVSIGKYLSTNDFRYVPTMDSVLNDIIDTCLKDGYDFGLGGSL